VEQAAGLCTGGENGLRYLRLWPHRHDTDGFFCGRLEAPVAGNPAKCPDLRIRVIS